MRIPMLSILLLCAHLMVACSSDGQASRESRQSSPDGVVGADYASGMDKLPKNLRAALVPLSDSTFITENPSLKSVLHPVGRLKITAEAAGSIRSGDIYHDGSVLLVDYRKDVFILDSHGGFKRKLSFEQCDPGYSWGPIRARFFPDGKILVVSNTLPAALIFDNTGECSRTLDLGTMLPIDASPVSNELVAVVYGTPEAILTSVVGLSGESTVIGTYTEQVDFLFRARPTSSVVAIDDNTLMWTLYTRHGVYVSDLDGNDPKFADLGHSGYKLYDTLDLNSGSNGVQDAIFSVTSSSTLLSGISRLDSRRIVVFYRHGFESFSESNRSMSLDIITADGSRLNSFPIYYRGYRSGWLGAYGGHLIRIRYDEEESSLEFYAVSDV